MFHLVKELKTKLRAHRQLRKWKHAGCTNPPPHPIKQNVVARYARAYNLSVFVETGTFRGDMVHAMRMQFQSIYSIELQAELCAAAKRRFAQDDHIHILNGDSGVVLRELLPSICSPTLFWLDGHWSGGETARAQLDTPVMAELAAILQHPLAGQHVILIDDARLFDGNSDYPTLQQIAGHVHKDLVADVSVENDVICIVPAVNVEQLSPIVLSPVA